MNKTGQNIWTISDIAAVVVIYNVALEECATFRSLNTALENMDEELDVFVYDNSPEPQFSWANKMLNRCRVHYVHDAQNPGVSKAYNKGAEYARQKEKNWILLLDDDTWLPSDGLKSYLAAIDQHIDQKLFVPVVVSKGIIISPSRFLFKRGFHVSRVTKGINSLKGKAPINSGMLIETELFFSSGGYTESIRLDFTDFDFRDRYSRVISTFVVTDIEVQHELSAIVNRYDKGKSLNRYESYCQGARAYADNCRAYFTLGFITLFRGLMLFLKHKSFRFLGIYFMYFVNKKQ